MEPKLNRPALLSDPYFIGTVPADITTTRRGLIEDDVILKLF